MDIADLLVDRGQVVGAMQRLGGLARLLQELERLVVREHALGVVAPRGASTSAIARRSPACVK